MLRTTERKVSVPYVNRYILFLDAQLLVFYPVLILK